MEDFLAKLKKFSWKKKIPTQSDLLNKIIEFPGSLQMDMLFGHEFFRVHIHQAISN